MSQLGSLSPLRSITLQTTKSRSLKTKIRVRFRVILKLAVFYTWKMMLFTFHKIRIRIIHMIFELFTNCIIPSMSIYLDLTLNNEVCIIVEFDLLNHHLIN